MRLLLTILLVSTICFSGVNYEASVEHFKIVNGDAGLELLVKGSARITDFIPIVIHDELIKQLYYGLYLGAGFSQQYTALRASQFSYNHYGHRLDLSLGAVFGNIECIYTHSIRETYPGASPDVLFFNKDVDSIKIRWKGSI
jgi:hypothetical protein